MDQIAARLMLAEDSEQAIREDMAAAITARRAAGPPPPRPAGKLRLLLVGYAGAGNVGADIRIQETARQLRAIFGRDRLELGLVTRGTSTIALDDVAQESVGGYFPATLDALIARYDAVIVCEGSLFKSNFSNTLTTMLAGALGMARAQRKPAIAYGVEAGAMETDMTAFVREFCRDSLIFCRSAGSLALVRDTLGLEAFPGTDTAWTFEPASSSAARAILAGMGWNGRDPVVALCPINPFWWPVRPDILRMLSGDIGSPDHYDSILYHHRSDETERRFAGYVAALAEAAGRHVAATGAFPIIIGMERIDRAACAALAAALPGSPPIVTSAELDARHIVAVLREAALVVTSRYHAAVTVMPVGVATVGVTMDERLRNLLVDSGCPQLAVDVHDPALRDTLATAIRQAHFDRATISEGARDFAARQLLAQAEMGRALAGSFAAILPCDEDREPTGFLPRLSPDLRGLLSGTAKPRTLA